MTSESLLTLNDNSLLDDSDLFIKPQKKHKVLMLADHPLAPSGVGVQARFLIEGLIAKGRWSFRCLGGAMKHANYDTVGVNPDFIVKPVDGFGTKDMIRSLLITERPDAIFLFTDPRQFIWIWEMEDEIHQICPIVYWHVWDNDPYPQFNFPWYESTDLINCLSYKTFEMVKAKFPEKTHYIPHAFPKQVFFPLPESQVKMLRQQNFGSRANWFSALWVNRNATRKMPADVLYGWKAFLEKLEKKNGHKEAILIMHTDPNDPEGPNLLAVSDMLGIANNVWFSTDKLGFDQMNVMHNITDCGINIAKNEGFGLSTLISMQCGKPIVALKTGGLTRQIVDSKDGFEYGAAIEPAKRSLVGSQMVPYIFEDYCTEEQVADALLKVFDFTDEQKAELKRRTEEHLKTEFDYGQVVDAWDKTMLECIESFQKKKQEGTNKRWGIYPLNVVDARPLVNALDNDLGGGSTRPTTDGSNNAAGSTTGGSLAPGLPSTSNSVPAARIDDNKQIRSGLKVKKMTRKKTVSQEAK